jgi:hypothetical protein
VLDDYMSGEADEWSIKPWNIYTAHPLSTERVSFSLEPHNDVTNKKKEKLFSIFNGGFSLETQDREKGTDTEMERQRKKNEKKIVMYRYR